MPSSKQDYFIIAVVAVISYYLGSLTGGCRLSSSIAKIDESTGIGFPISQPFHVSKNSPMTLLGVGTRKKTVLNIYSLGFYISEPIVKAIDKVSSSGNDAEICKSIMTSKAPKAVKLTFAMGIGPEKIAEAMSQLGKDVDEQVKSDFQKLLLDGMQGGKMRKDESMTFEWQGHDMIVVTIRGKPVGSMKDKALASGVLDLYLGPKSVSPTLRKDLGCA